MITPNPEEQAEVMHLRQQLRHHGEQVSRLEWRSQTVASILLRTVTGADYLIETRPEQPSLVTRLAEAGPLLDYTGPRIPVIIFRHEGNPDGLLEVGRRVDVVGLSKTSPGHDPDSIYTMGPLTDIRYAPL